MNYLYDESFEGFLSCVYHHWYTEKACGIFSEDAYQLDLTRYAMSVETDVEKAMRVLDAITDKISKWDARRVYQAFCSCEAEKEMKLLRYIALGFDKGSRIRLLHGDPVVKAVEIAESKVGIECHRLLGLIRFQEVQSVKDNNLLLYAKVEPDNDLLEFIADHFADRFKSEPFIIHDLKRGKAVFACGLKWEIGELQKDAFSNLREHDCGYASLWKGYFDVMGTKERTNPLCQRRFMPTRYWKHLTEMKAD